jgi:RHS repeat-associated protein
VTDANGVTVTNSHDSLGRLLSRTYPDGGVETFGYSARGLIAYTNQIGASNFFAYDAASRKTYETNANGEVIHYTYSSAGDLLTLTDGKAQVTTWHQDEFGRVTNKLDQGGSEILRYKYDADGHLTNRWSAEKGNTYYAFDPVGNLTNIDYPSSPDVHLAYDALDRLTNMVDAVGTTVYGYTAGNQLLTEDGPWASDTVTNTYQNRLRVALVLQQPTGTWTNGFAHDPGARLTNVTSQAGTFSYEYFSGVGGASRFSSALVKRLLLPNTSIMTNSFDADARVLGTYLRTSDGTLTNKHEYIYNPASQRTNETRMDASAVAYSYDKLGQLKVADSSVSSEDRGYAYDTGWNLNYRTNNGSLETFQVNGLNELTNAPSPAGAMTFDANGNLITSHSGWVYTYDDENRLIQLEDTSSNHVFMTKFFYDGLGRLRIRQEFVLAAATNPPPDGPTLGGPDLGGAESPDWMLSLEVRYLYDGLRVMQERDSNNVPTVSYTRGNDLSGTLEGAGGIGGLLARSHGYSGGNWSTHNYYHADGNGNITFMLNSSQSMVASYRFDPFGNTLSSSGSLADANVYRFSSKECCTNCGMYYYLYRFYDPVLQRWINRDPVSEAGFLSTSPLRGAAVGEEANLFAFALNDALTHWDALGLVVEREAPPPDPSLGRTHKMLVYCYQPGLRCLNLRFTYTFYRRPGDKPANEKAFQACLNPPGKPPLWQVLQATCALDMEYSFFSIAKKIENCYNHHW